MIGPRPDVNFPVISLSKQSYSTIVTYLLERPRPELVSDCGRSQLVPKSIRLLAFRPGAAYDGIHLFDE